MSTIAKEYAEALFAIAIEDNTIDEIADGAALISEQFKANPEYPELLSAPSIPRAERVELFETCFEGKVPETLLHYASVMLSRGDIRAFDDSIREYNNLRFATKSVSNATVTSAVPLTKKELMRLTAKLEKLSGNAVRLTTRIDPALIGGAVVEIDGRIIEGSIKQRIRELKGIISQ